ncbi:hypothetical protein [Cellulomonas cellasea]|uniref:N-acetyltransferase domain-containing protein n=1 Tax=Cellulomonas cellasea TaxID=43670 RepID=A0A7W4UH78_9CELL|nr:hypothetical protein [Cellulomonas cellasea]MBB2924105.1 hypothetical protein [Cellulomonas cellasea]
MNLAQPLRWREAVASDRALLLQWTCTTPGRRRYDAALKARTHPREWEWKVQSEIRSLEPPLRGARHLLVGEDAEGIAAVALYEDVDPEAGDYYIGAVAVAARRRRRSEGGSTLGPEALELVLQTIAGDARPRGVTTAIVSVRIDARNGASKRLCSEAGFVYLDVDAWGFERWAYGFDPHERVSSSTGDGEGRPEPTFKT